jgi:hypothetical protein
MRKMTRSNVTTIEYVENKKKPLDLWHHRMMLISKSRILKMSCLLHASILHVEQRRSGYWVNLKIA